MTKNPAGRGALALLLLCVLTQCAEPGRDTAVAGGPPMPATDRISMADFKKLLATNEVVVLDVRSMEAYAAGHIPGSLSMPEESLDAKAAEKLKRLGKEVATYCS